jgi:very-short-patch-repair endonuclease
MHSDRDPTWRLRGFARVMRHEPTDGERRLWSRLRDRRLNGYKFRRQVPIEGFIVDFYCMEAKLIVEIDGSQHFEASGRL